MSAVRISRGKAPVIISIPHAGTDIPADIAARLVSPWLARKDADWWVAELYDFAEDLGITTIAATASRTVIDVNRDPSGASLYPGQATTSLCPVDTFDGEPLYKDGRAPGAEEIARRRVIWFDPYHAALRAEIARLKTVHGKVVLYDAHAIRSVVPRLFDGELPQFNIGTYGGRSCDPALSRALATVCAASPFSHIVDGRFKGGWITRRYGDPGAGVHALQMELACRGYVDEPSVPTPQNWPPHFDRVRAAELVTWLKAALTACLAFTGARP